MPDLICPPPWGQKPPCPCRAVRYGFGLLSMCAYSAVYSSVFFGKPFGAVVGPVLRGDASIYDWPIVWLGAFLVGALCFGEGVRRIASEGHAFKFGSFVWSVGVVALVAWRLANFPNCIGQPDWLGGTITAFNWHFLRMVLVSWLAANAANIALNLHAVIAWWQRRFPRREVAASQPVPRGLLHGWSRSVTMIEEIEGLPEHVLAAAQSSAHRPPHIAPDVLEQLGDVPLIDLVPDEKGNFIPLDLRSRKRVR